jgi:hypothetical protein
MPKGKGPPTRSTDKFPQDLTGGGKIGMRHTPPAKTGMGPPTRATGTFPQELTAGHIGRRHTPPTT